MLKCNGKDIKGKTIVVSGAGNVAIYAIQKAWQPPATRFFASSRFSSFWVAQGRATSHFTVQTLLPGAHSWYWALDAKLQSIMVNIFHSLDAAAKKYGMEGN